MEYEYMVRERAGKFIIMCRYEETVGILWWKKKKMSDWRRCDANGYPTIWAPPIHTNGLEPFNSLEGAKARIRLFQKATVDHIIT